MQFAAGPILPAGPRADAPSLPTAQPPQLQRGQGVRHISLASARARDPPHTAPLQPVPPLRVSLIADSSTSLEATLRREGFLAGLAAARPQGPSPHIIFTAKAAGASRREHAGATREAPPPLTPPQSQQSTPRLHTVAKPENAPGAQAGPSFPTSQQQQQQQAAPGLRTVPKADSSISSRRKLMALLQQEGYRAGKEAVRRQGLLEMWGASDLLRRQEGLSAGAEMRRWSRVLQEGGHSDQLRRQQHGVFGVEGRRWLNLLNVLGASEPLTGPKHIKQRHQQEVDLIIVEMKRRLQLLR